MQTILQQASGSTTVSLRRYNDWTLRNNTTTFHITDWLQMSHLCDLVSLPHCHRHNRQLRPSSAVRRRWRSAGNWRSPPNAAERDVAAPTRLSGCVATSAAAVARRLAVVAAAGDAGGGGGGCLPAVVPRAVAGWLTVAARDVAC